MANIIYGGQSYACEGQSVLDCLTAQGVAIPSSCRAGACQTCLMRAVKGKVPEKAQTGLKPTLIAQNYFLACSFFPAEDVEIAAPTDIIKLPAKVTRMERLASDIMGIRLKPAQPFEYRAGQFINFYKDEATVRSYSMASVPELEDELFLNVRKVPNGLVSNWIFNDLKAGDSITISEAAGDCFYVAGRPEQNLLLVGTGSGLAPLYGIIRDALLQGHTGRIALYHGNYNAAGFYLVEELKQLAKDHPNFSYTPCVSEGDAPEGFATGMVLDVALKDNPDLSGWRIFLCGNPMMVNAAKREAFMAGASMQEIYADPFGAV
jgi:ferredoxin-NADP reductase/ferredoxin